MKLSFFNRDREDNQSRIGFCTIIFSYGSEFSILPIRKFRYYAFHLPVRLVEIGFAQVPLGCD